MSTLDSPWSTSSLTTLPVPGAMPNPWADAGDNHIVARPVRDVDDRQIVWDLLHHAGPASDYRHVRRSRKQLGQPPRDVHYKGGVGLVGITGQAHVGPFVGSSAKKQIAPRGLASV